MDGCLASDPPPGALAVERVCERSGELTVHYHTKIPGDHALDEANVWQWICTAVTRDDLEEGR